MAPLTLPVFDWHTNGLYCKDNTTAPTETRTLPLLSLKGKTAIVSGAGAGIGLVVAEAYAEAGANVALWYNSNAQALKEAERLTCEYGGLCKAYQVDVTDEAAIKSAIETAVSDLGGRLDIFVANSGMVWLHGPVIGTAAADFERIFNVNVMSVRHCAAHAGAHFKGQKETGKDIHGKPLQNFTYGSFIATSSILDRVQAWPQSAAPYAATKAAVTHFCKGLAVEWVRFARVNVVSPGYIDTNILGPAPDEWRTAWDQRTPMGRIGKVHELKGAYLYLASDASSFATGLDMILDGGMTLV